MANLGALLQSFAVGGSTVAGINYLGNYMSPLAAGIFAGVPIGLPSGYYIGNDKAAAYYSHLVVMTFVLFLATLVTYVLIVNYKMDKNKAIGLGMLTWFMCGLLYYLYKANA